MSDTKNDSSQFEIQFFRSILEKIPDYIQVIEILGCLYTEAGQIDEGLRMDERAVKITPNNPNAHYNLACSLALKGETAKAIDSLKKAIDLGYVDLEWMLQDEDLQSLHGHTKFEKLITRLGTILK